jgi:HEAT repeat protein
MPLVRKTGAAPTPPSGNAASFATALQSGNADERWAAARTAHEIADSVGPLGKALSREQDSRVRAAMFTSLVRLASAQSIEVIQSFLRADDASLRTGALDALQALKGAISPYLPRLLSDEDPDVRLLACELARNIPPAEASRLLCALLDAESQANVCAAAVEILAASGHPDALPALARCEQRFRDNQFLSFAIQVAVDQIRTQSAR